MGSGLGGKMGGSEQEEEESGREVETGWEGGGGTQDRDGGGAWERRGRRGHGGRGTSSSVCRERWEGEVCIVPSCPNSHWTLLSSLLPPSLTSPGKEGEGEREGRVKTRTN